MYQIKIYEDKNGKSEIRDYFDKLIKSNDKDTRIKSKKIAMYLDLLSLHGLSLGEPYIKKLDNSIWELRPIRDRILFASIKDNNIVLLSIFMKQSRKTPKREIEKAKRNLNDYLRSDENE